MNLGVRIPRGLIAVGLLAAAIAAHAPAQSTEYSVENTLLLPQRFYVGDRVEARVQLRLAETAQAPTRAPETTPDPDWGTIHAISIDGSGRDYEVRIGFTPYQPGTLTFPPLDLGALTLRGVDFHVESILDGQSAELAPVRSQLLLPSTRMFIGVAAVVLVLIPVVALAFFPWIRAAVRRMLGSYRAGQPYRKLRRRAGQLRAEADRLEGRSFYIRLLEEARRYLSHKFGFDCMSATTREMQSVLATQLTEQSQREQLMALFHTGDLVKFASRRAPVEKRLEDLERLTSVAASLERQRKERQRKGGRSRGQGHGRGRRRREGSHVGV